ncbi:MAG: group II intron maturase-specific domain-containing protein [Solirubrobacteraceae bacterium]
MGHARERIRQITARSRLRVPVENIVQDLNRFLRGWAGYFRHGNSAQFFDKITRYALMRLAGFIAKRHKRCTRYGWWVAVYQSPNRMGLIDLNGTIVASRPTQSRPPGS